LMVPSLPSAGGLTHNFLYFKHFTSGRMQCIRPYSMDLVLKCTLEK
jgi:hypothetical protein